jgi:hypothetical protein
MYSAEPLPHFVDEYLAYLHEVHPTSATFDGVHLHDDLLEDLGRSAIDSQIRDLGGFARRLAAIDPTRLTDTERLERPALDSSLRARLFELERVRTWERSPQLYADIIATSLAAQALFDYAPLTERARRVLSKLRQVPRVIQAARENVKDPPGIYVKAGLESMRGTQRFIDEDLPRVFGDLGDLHLLGDLADAAAEAAASVAGYAEYLEQDLAPRSRGSFRLGRDRFEEKLRLEEGLTLPADRLLAIAMRELRQTQEEFRRAASRLNGGDPLQAWARLKKEHPPAGQLVPAAHQQLQELVEFITRERIVTVPEGAPVLVAPTPRFYRWTFREHVDAGPVRITAAACLLLPDRHRALVAGRAPAGAPARLQLRCALGHLDSRGLPGALPALPAPAADPVEAPQVDPLLVDRVRRGLGALLRADDGGGGLPAR